MGGHDDTSPEAISAFGRGRCRAAGGVGDSQAQTYPTRPIKLVIPFPPGGVNDAIGRPWADKMKTRLGTIVIENIGGAAGLPAPGSMLNGEPVTDKTTRRAPIEPVSEALLKLPAGSVALVGLNSENIYAILNRLGVPVATLGQSCVKGSMCVPCTSNECYPRDDFDHLWHVVREPGRAEPLAYLELRYGAGWSGQ